MPLYEYECQGCGQRTETLQRMAEAPLTVCPECGGPLKKLVSRGGFAFKGSGWYVTDYAGKKGASKADKSATEGGSSSGDSSSSAGEAKTDKTDKTDKSKDSAALSSPPKTAASS
jgi:putative FmdB family regulatory protein